MKKNKTLIISLPFLAALLLYGAYQYGYVKIRTDVDSLKEEQTAKTKLLEKSVALIAEKPLLEKRLAALKAEKEADRTKLIEGQTLSLSAATLQETIKGIVTGRGGSISSERVGKPEDYGNFKIITVSIDAVLPDARALSDILYSIETRTPYLVVKELDTRVRNYRDPRDLTVKLDVSALTSGK
ncbi:MAG: type II secretion system protein GspM [Nitrospiraceae bacterium]|nr:type II secretion system protein GspM [Nitrospiraceae bacterium]